MFLKKIKYTSGASRNIKVLTSHILLKSKYTQLWFRKRSLGGRGSSGRIILWTKGSVKHRYKTPLINYMYRSTTLSMVATFHLTPLSNKLVALCFLSDGCVTYLQSTNKYTLFSFSTFPNLLRKTGGDFWTPVLSILMYMKTLSKVSLLELFPGSGAQYARSAGTSARFINIDWLTHTAVIELPSNVRKSFSIYATASLGVVSLKNKRLTSNTRAGYWRNLGWKSTVRGVAMNPVDHPHGGRTKAIKNPRTPWGKTTKLK